MATTSVAGWSYVIPNIYTWDGNACAHLLQDRRLAHADHAADGPVRLGTLARGRSAVGAHRPAPDRLAPPLRHLWHHRRLRGPLGHPGREPQGHALHRRGVRHHAHAVGLCQLRAHLQPAEQGPQQQSTVAVIGSNAEAGLKAELFERRIQAHFAVFQTKQDNFGVRDRRHHPPLPAALPYVAVNGTKSTGFELEFAGMAANSGGECRPDPRQGHRAPTDLIYANMPDYLLQLGTDYQLSALAPLSVGGNLTWQSSGKASTSRTPAAP